MELISVIMAAYNTEVYITDAISSILNQTHKNLELIIVNDCSTDRTEDKILSFKDNRIKYFKNQQKIGPGGSRNKALSKASGEFIAIMDSDDIAEPGRLTEQLNYLKKHPAIDVLGGAIKVFGNIKERTITFPQSPGFINCWLLFNSCIAHNASFLRGKLLTDGILNYNDFWFGQDYYLFYNLSRKGIKITNLPQVLLHYRIHDSQITNQSLERRAKETNQRFAERIYDTFQFEIPAKDSQSIAQFIHTRIVVNNTAFKGIKHFLDKLYMENLRSKIYKPVYFNAVLYFFYLRLGKYYYLENKKPLKFFKYFSAVVYMLGLRSLYIFLKNNKGFR